MEPYRGKKLRKLTSQPTVKIDGLVLPIQNTGKDGTIYNCYVEPLQKFKREIDAMLSHHDKIFIYGFDVHVCTHSQTNEQMTKFLRSYIPRVKRYYKTKNTPSFELNSSVGVFQCTMNMVEVAGVEPASEDVQCPDLHA